VRIACLHTAKSNVPVFESALRELDLIGVELRHSVRPDLLAAAEQAGGLTPAIAQRTRDALRALCADADAVLLTCSTLGPAVAEAAATTSVPLLRVDGALARQAVRDGGKIVVLCAVETTLEPSRHLFEEAARVTGAEKVLPVSRSHRLLGASKAGNKFSRTTSEPQSGPAHPSV
jgi:hypothetical protein